MYFLLTSNFLFTACNKISTGTISIQDPKENHYDLIEVSHFKSKDRGSRFKIALVLNEKGSNSMSICHLTKGLSSQKYDLFVFEPAQKQLGGVQGD